MVQAINNSFIGQGVTAVPKAALPLALLAACSVEPRDCVDYSLPHEFVGEPPFDVGAVLVARVDAGGIVFEAIDTKWSNIELIDCKERDEIIFNLYNSSIIDRTTAGHPPWEENAIEFRAFFESDATTTKDEILAKARELGIETNIRKLDREHCGCAAFYPELMGDQEPAEERNA